VLGAVRRSALGQDLLCRGARRRELGRPLTKGGGVDADGDRDGRRRRHMLLRWLSWVTAVEGRTGLGLGVGTEKARTACRLRPMAEAFAGAGFSSRKRRTVTPGATHAAHAFLVALAFFAERPYACFPTSVPGVGLAVVSGSWGLEDRLHFRERGWFKLVVRPLASAPPAAAEQARVIVSRPSDRHGQALVVILGTRKVGVRRARVHHRLPISYASAAHLDGLVGRRGGADTAGGVSDFPGECAAGACAKPGGTFFVGFAWRPVIFHRHSQEILADWGLRDRHEAAHVNDGQLLCGSRCACPDGNGARSHNGDHNKRVLQRTIRDA